MATYAHSTTAPTRHLLPSAASRAAPTRDVRGRFVRRAELPPELISASADEAESTASAASAARASSPKAAPESTTSPRPPGHAAALPHPVPPIRLVPEPAFDAVRAFDRAVAEWDATFGEWLSIMEALDPGGLLCWDNPVVVARTVLGPIAGSTVAMLDHLLRRLDALDPLREAAEAHLLSTRATTEIGVAALRAAVRRYARRPFGCRSDEPVMLAQLAA